MIEHLPNIPKFITTCQKYGLVVEEVEEGVWKTWCKAAHECYGCDGQSKFSCLADPRGFRYYKCYDSMQIIPITTPQRLWMNKEEIESILEGYRGPGETYYWNREIRADLDSVVIYIWEEPEG